MTIIFRFIASKGKRLHEHKMFTEKRIQVWFKVKRPVWIEPRVVIHHDIAFIYSRLLKGDSEKNIARISLTNKKQLDKLNPFEWL